MLIELLYILLKILWIVILLLLIAPFLLRPRVRRLQKRQKGDVIIVLGCRALDTGEPGKHLAARINRAAELYRNGNAPMLIVTGSAVYNNHIEADVMTRCLIEKGVPESAIIREPQARNTAENARYTAAILKEKGFDRPIVVTSPEHITRASMLFQREGYSPAMCPAKRIAGIPLYRKIRFIIAENILVMKLVVRDLVSVISKSS